MGIARGAGLLAGMLLDAAIGDPRRWHPVAGMGLTAQRVESVLYRDSRFAGVAYTAACVGIPTLFAVAALRCRSAPTEFVATAFVTWVVVGRRSLAEAGEQIAGHVAAGDLAAGRGLISHLCGRDPEYLDGAGLIRAATESVAENTSDAVVAPLFWGTVVGLPGMLAYRMINTLDAMVGRRDERYRRFGWASARLDDVVNWVPARLTGLIVIGLGPDRRGAWRAWRRDAAAHPSPNAGVAESSFAGALGIRLGGLTVYPHGTERRPVLGDGPEPGPDDLAAACRMSRRVGWAMTAACVAAAVRTAGQRP